ncbi:MAG: transcription termination factor Rho [Armatimonadota bacterium]
METQQLESKTMTELKGMAQDLGIRVRSRASKNELINRIAQARPQPDKNGLVYTEGILEVLPDQSQGYLRTSGYAPNPETDVYVASTQIKRCNLRTGDFVGGMSRPPKENERFYGLLKVESVNGRPPEEYRDRPQFEELTPIYPDERLRLEIENSNTHLSARFLDIITPLGKGQRGLIISPPKAGKTTLVKEIANSISHNYPEVRLMVLLVDERPEEVTDIERSVNGEVASSTFDEQPDNHMKVAEMVLAKAKRMVEDGEDVVILLDSITRLARASNLTVTPSGRTLSGGLDPTALYRPKRFFGAARNIENGGSLTILATILVETGSRMDDMIYEEFKATGNMDLRLERELADKGIFPAIDIPRSSTRHQELLFEDDEMQKVWQVRRALHALETEHATELLIAGLRKSKSNSEFLAMAEHTFRARG